MTTDAEIKEKFWKSLKSDMTVMLGLVGVSQAQAEPDRDGCVLFLGTLEPSCSASSASMTPTRGR